MRDIFYYTCRVRSDPERTYYLKTETDSLDKPAAKLILKEQYGLEPDDKAFELDRLSDESKIACINNDFTIRKTIRTIEHVCTFYQEPDEAVGVLATHQNSNDPNEPFASIIYAPKCVVEHGLFNASTFDLFEQIIAEFTHAATPVTNTTPQHFKDAVHEILPDLPDGETPNAMYIKWNALFKIPSDVLARYGVRFEPIDVIRIVNIDMDEQVFYFPELP